MNKQELVSRVSEAMGTSKKEAEIFVNTFVSVVTDELVNKGEVKISGFGTFATSEVPEKTGTIQLGDRKGETYTTPAHTKPTFKYLSAVKNAVKGE